MHKATWHETDKVDRYCNTSRHPTDWSSSATHGGVVESLATGKPRLRANSLIQEFTYVSIELGELYMPTATPDSYMKTYWEHRCTIAHLAATDRRWKEILARMMTHPLVNFMKDSRGDVMLEDFHWIARPRARVHYRGIERVNDELARDKRHAEPAIIIFSWKTAQPLATTDPPRLFHATKYKHQNGEEMTNEHAVRRR